MLDALVRASIRSRGLVMLVVVALVAASVAVLGRARFDVLPDFTPALVVVQTEAPGLGAPDVDVFVTTPLEQVLLGTPQATTVRSSSSPGLSVITLFFQDGVDLFTARQVVNERLALAAGKLPRGADEPRVAPISAPIGALTKLCVTAASGSPDDLRALHTWAEFTLEPRLLAIPGVAQVTVHGGEIARLEVQPDPVRLLETGLSIEAVAEAVRGSAVFGGGGFVESGAARLDVEVDAHLDPDTAVDTLSNTVIRSNRGAPVRLGDVAWVGVASTPPVGSASFDGKPAVYLQVTKLPWADTLATSAAVDAELATRAPSAPAGATVQAPVFKQADFVRTSVRALTRSMAIGAMLVVAVLLAFLRSPRLALISLTAIPLSILSAAAILVASGASIDGMILGGLAIAVGEVVDDAIVDVENVWRRLRANARVESPRPPLEVVADASIEVRGSVVYATVLVAVVLVPILTLGGISGRIFAPLAQAYILAIVASLGVALTVTPALCALLLPAIATAEARPTRLATTFVDVYRRLLACVVRWPKLVVGATVALSFIPLIALPLMGGRFLPEFHEGSLIGHVFAVPGTSLAETTRRADDVARQALAPAAPDLRPQDGLLTWLTTTPTTHVAHVAARVGRAALDEDAAPADRIEVDFRLPDDFAGEWDLAVTDIAKQIGAVPGVGFVVEGFLGERIHEVLSGETAPVVVKVTGPDLAGVRAVAADALALMTDVPGLGGLRVDPQVDVPQLRVRPRANDLARAGVRAADVIGQLTLWRQGLPQTEAMSKDGRLLDVVVAGPPAFREESMLRDVPIQIATGAWWPLSSLADIEPVPAPASIAHEAGLVVLHIGANAPGASLTGAVSRLQAAFDDHLIVPHGYHVDIGGEAAARNDAAYDLLLVGALVLGGIFALLSAAFGSSKDAGIVLLNLPLGLLGGVTAALLLPDGLSVSGFVGFVTLLGICARNGIMLVSHIKQLDTERPDLTARQRVLLASEERLLPILMTAATAGLGLLPLALSGESAGSELESPMALIVCGGLVTSTTLNMLVLPTIYAWRAG